jgi:hypothetical protein
VFHMFLRAPHMAQERAEAAMALASEHGFELGYGTFARGFRALANQGHMEEGVAESSEISDVFRVRQRFVLARHETM